MILPLLVAVLFLVALVSVPVFAADAQEPAEKDKVLIRIYEKDPEAKTTFFNLETKEMLLKPVDGYVEIIQEETVLKALQVSYAQKEQKAVLTDEVSVYQPDLDLTADKLTAWLETEDYLAEGNVHLVQWNLGEDNQRAERKLSLDAQFVRMDAKTNNIYAEGNVYVEEADRRIWADILDYNDQEELMVLNGNVHIETEDGSHLFGNRVVIDLATDEATVYGPVTAEFIIEQTSSEE